VREINFLPHFPSPQPSPNGRGGSAVVLHALLLSLPGASNKIYERHATRQSNKPGAPEIRALSAYHVPDPGALIKLDAMENPYGWPPHMVQSWLETLSTVPLNRYPDPGGRAVQEALRGAMAIPAEYDILLGNGSDELIQMILMAVAQPGRW